MLDGSVSPDATDEQELTAQARGFDRTYESFVETCDADPECPLGPDTAATMQRTRDQLEQSPVEVSDESGTRELSRDLFDLGVATALYDTSLWSALSNAVADLSDGGAEVLLSLVDRQTGRQPDGSYDNSSDAQVMVSCSDTSERPGVDDALAAAERIAAAAPTFGELTAFGALTCVGWPEPANPLPTPTGEDAPPVLVVGTVGDPATPYEWSVQMSEALQSGVLLTYEGDGHTAFLRGGECIDDAVVDYLVDLVVPDEGTRCPAVAEESGLTSLRDELIAQLSERGTPEQLAECVVDGAIDEVGEEEFERLVLGSDQQEITRLFSAQALRCAAGGDCRSGQKTRETPHCGHAADDHHGGGAPCRWACLRGAVLRRSEPREQRAHDQGGAEGEHHPRQEVLPQEQLRVVLLCRHQRRGQGAGRDHRRSFVQHPHGAAADPTTT